MGLADLTSGGSCRFVLGPNHPAIEAARDRPDADAPARLAAWLTQRSGLAVLALTSTHEDARAKALEVARAATGRTGVVACRGSATEPGARLVSHGDGLQLEAALAREPAAAFVVEVVQVRGGLRVPPPGYFERVEAARTTHAALLVADESELGFGRAGTMFAYEKEAAPDLVVLSFAVAPGLAGGAVLVSPRLGHTTAEPQLAAETASAVLALIDVVEREQLAARAKQLGKMFKKGVGEILDTRRTWAMDTRGRGLVRTLATWESPRRVVDACRARGLAIDTTGDTALLLAPPLTATAEDITESLAALDAVLATSVS